MTPLFADTFYWVAITNLKDSAAQRALTLIEEREAAPLVTTDEVLTEYLAYFAKTRQELRSEAGRIARHILSDSSVRVIPQSRQSFLGGLDLYLARPDKGYSLTDCISMQTMRREGITEALTNDRHFEQEGFRALFR